MNDRDVLVWRIVELFWSHAVFLANPIGPLNHETVLRRRATLPYSDSSPVIPRLKNILSQETGDE